MKNKFKKAFIGGLVGAMELTAGYAVSTAFQDLDAIRDNFDYILGISQSQESTIGVLNSTIAGLEAEIAELEENQNNSGKQERIKELEAQVESLIAERDGLMARNTELETRISELRVYTDMYVEVAE